MKETLQKEFTPETLFTRHKYALPKAWNIEYFWSFYHIIRGLHVALNPQNTSFQKIVWPKNCLDAAREVFLLKNNFMVPFYDVELSLGYRATSSILFTFSHSVSRISGYSFNQPPHLNRKG